MRRLARRDARSRPGGRGRRRARAAVGRQGARAGRRGRARRRRAAGLFRRQRALGDRGTARAGGGLRRCPRRLRLWSGPFPRRRRDEPGGPVLALRDGHPGARVPAAVGHRGQRRHLRRAPRGVRARRPDHGPRPVAALQRRQARVARGLRTRGTGRREDGPHRGGRVRPQAAHDEPCLADRPARRAAVAARVSAALRPHGRLAPAAALRDALPARGGAGGQRGAARPGLGLRRHLRHPGRSAGRGARRGPGPCAGAAGRALLRAHDGLGGGRVVGLPAPRDAGGVAPPEGTR